MNFATAISNESRKSYTENGATAYNSTGSALLDLFASIGALRGADEARINRLFADAYMEDPLLATKCLFYARDVRGGLGERKVFRTLLRYAAEMHPEAIRNNIHLIPFYGRWDDLYAFVGTSLEDLMWKVMLHQFNHDREAMKKGEACSLLAKWLKTADASSEKTRQLGILTAKNFHMSVYDYKRQVRALRKYIDVTEVKMSRKEWEEINYPAVPSKAMTNYRNAFRRHDEQRFSAFLQKVNSGEEKINASTLYPYDLVEKYFNSCGWVMRFPSEEDPVVEAQWKALPNYVAPGSNAIVIADTSGSMLGRPMNSAVALALYFAERNTGAYHGLWMSFSDDSKIQRMKGETLLQKVRNMDYDHWGGSTNLEAAFMKILDIAVRNHVDPDEMVKSIIVISDMEINHCTGEWSFYDEMDARFMHYGYRIPNVVFWNVESRHDTFLVDSDRRGVMLVSGQASSTFKHVVGAVDKTPVEMMLDVLNSDRYMPVTVK